MFAHLQAVADGGELDENGLRALRDASPARAAEILAVCREFNWQPVTWESPYYPDALRALRDPPAVLFAAGDLRLLQRPLKAAVVGTRGASDAAMGVAYGIGANYSANGVVTVSGCARGIDSAAAEGALAFGGSTIGVLGNGFGYNYMPEQVFFRRRLLRQGLLLTELPPFAAPTRYSFPRRNRIIAGLSASVTVVESGARGGSLITAQDARRQGKPVFVPDASLLASAGCADLAQNGAETFTDAAALFGPLAEAAGPAFRPKLSPLQPFAADPPAILFPARMTAEEFALASGVSPGEAKDVYETLTRAAPKGGGQTPAVKLPEQMSFDLRPKQNRKKTEARPERGGAEMPAEKPAEKPAERPGPDGDQRIIYDALADGALTMDDLCARTGLPIGTVLQMATMLELKGYLRTLPGNAVARI